MVDYFSHYIEIAQQDRPNALEVIMRMKSIFARHGIPEVVVSDNEPQYSYEAFKEFASDFQFRHDTSSPYYPQGNGEAERAVKTIKSYLKRTATLTRLCWPTGQRQQQPATVRVSS